ncbi:MAG: TonB-dependent hemoglobin/transferrin/lactoferrin family receptor [Halieaceae bacterium]|nr:TonB-dependent hemoglobin/transferrin/lactoferrin family receptor [Halieaceae bacterium]
MYSRTRTAVLVAAVTQASLALAQPGNEDPQPRLEEVTVYGTSNATSLFEYPGQVSVIDRDAIDNIVPSTMSDLLRDVPSVEFSGGPRRTGESPAIRGRGGDNVLILIDGARQSFSSAHDGRFFVEPELLRSAEVVRGPASSLYGSGAVGGVMAFETLDAADLLRGDSGFGGRFRAGYQDVNEETNLGATLYYKEGGLDLLGSYSWRDSGDIELGSGDTLGSDDDIDSALLKGSYAVSDSLELEASYTLFRNTALEPNNGQGINEGDPADPGTLVDKDIDADSYSLTARFAPETPWVDSTLTLYRSETAVDEAEIGTSRRVLRDIDTDGVTFRNASRLDSDNNHRLTIGGDWYNDAQKGRDNAADDGLRGGVPNGDSDFLGVFAQLESSFQRPLGLPGELLIIPAVRYDSYESEADDLDSEDVDDDAVSPRLAMSYGPVDWFRGFASYAEGFRAPSVNETFLSGTHFSLPHPVLGPPVFITNEFVPNPDLSAETSESIELGFALDFADVVSSGDQVSLKTSYYRSDIEDLIDLSVDFAFDRTCFAPPFAPCSAGTSFSQNIASAEIDGYELEARYDSERFLAVMAYSSIDGENNDSGADLGVLTPDRVNVDLRWRLPAWDAALGSRIQYADSFSRVAEGPTGDLETIERRGSYTLVDLYATWQPSFMPGWRIDAGVNNVADEDYERVFEGVSEPGRNLRLALTWQADF